MMEKQNDFWQDHSLVYLEMAFRTDRIEKVENPDGHGKKTGECGDTVEFFLNMENEMISSVSFLVDGCMNTTACANAICEMTEGKSPEQAWEITPERIAAYLQTLPEDHYHCAELAAGAFYLALNDLKKDRN